MSNSCYTGKLLRINLTDQTFAVEEIPSAIQKDYLGGAGVAIKYLFDEVDPSIDPLSEENKLIFMDGPLTGTSTPCASRMSVTSKSPLTNAVGMCMTGGYFPAELKFAGYDGLIIEGKSEKPVYVWIKDDKVSFKSAENLWGTTTQDCQQIIKEKLADQNIRIACIGPAGEKLSRISCIINERRAAGRKGLGAVMGSKNLKAIAVRGTGTVGIANPQQYKDALKVYQKALKESPVLYTEFSKMGTPMTVDAVWGHGILPTKNYSATGAWAPIDDLGAAANEKYKIGNEHCYKCPVGCSQMKLVKKGRHAGMMSDPEFETIYSFGATTGVTDLDYVITGDRICDEQGMDTVSAGVTIAFAMELFERGILKETDGLKLNFGNGEAMLDLLMKMAHRDGIGDLFADGSDAAAKKIGGEAWKYTVTVKGLEMPGYDVRGAKAHGLSMATSYTGGDHNRGYAFQEIFGIPVPYPVDRFETKGKGILTKWNQDNRCVTCDCATMCAFLMDMAVPAIATQNTADLVNGAAGTDYTAEQISKIGERINNVARLFNIGCGFTRNDDRLPYRVMNEPISDGPSKGHFIPQDDLDMMLDEYYEARNWTKEGVPTKEKIEELGINEALEFLERIKK